MQFKYDFINQVPPPQSLPQTCVTMVCIVAIILSPIFLQADTPDVQSPNSRPDEASLNWQFFAGKPNIKKMPSSSSLTLSSIPTRPRDWVVMHALPKELKQWNASALYVIGNRSALPEIPSDGYSNCTFVPVDVSFH